ncbi:helix-turn-helix transcriptional regulator [Elizabethkingia sp. HX WHF]|uniref:helix-turn-helix domain-containing protein n=1 Tax=Elizabethkingia TaxID=308865 RepID=UPI0009992E03|nr:MULTISPECIES: helix-turn-helix transcriptional regulator [Elizabethkingia]ATL42927.1 AraC family transcriptional regulator [Elizabethkingia miricola]MCL1637494.1 helix-turn-helix transcriptional regulator [Elizabethkingia bruuniana]MDX8563204.1 helix-turn-helix transcriptional regulator [Elizabethkingia sp. HX WHF]OPC19749.1 transcriptional regulator [Elizabethkingia bruuniana]
MKTSETLQEFYTRTLPGKDVSKLLCCPGVGHVNIFSRESCARVTPYSRRDYYKISLIIGEGKLHYADRWICIDRPALLFSSPLIPYSWEATSEDQSGWFCLFTEHFLKNGNMGNIQDSNFYKIGGEPVFFLNDDQVKSVELLFSRIKEEIDADYVHKYDVIRNYLQLLVHEAMKMSPAQSYERYNNASQRVASLFMDLMERQYPIDGTANPLRLKSAVDYAQNLNIHVNSLNRALKTVTGKTTSELIANRIVQEAKALLNHTDWNINEIAFCLGFDDSAYFTNFFRKQTRLSPAAYRSKVV